jgi:hypothetical protein
MVITKLYSHFSITRLIQFGQIIIQGGIKNGHKNFSGICYTTLNF